MLFLIENIRAFNSYAESMKLYNSFLAAHPYISISFLPEYKVSFVHKTNAAFLFYFLICTYSTKTLYLWLTKERLKGKGTLAWPTTRK